MSKFNLVKYMWYRKVHPKLRKISGLPPLSFQSKRASTLKNYRIYGNTVDGNSVGDRTGNLFDGTFIHRSVIGDTVGDDNPNRRSIVVDVSSYANGNEITFSREMGVGSTFQMYQVNSPLKGGALLNSNVFSGNSETLLATITLDNIANYHYLMIFLNGATNPITDEELLASKIMVNVGNTPLPYEPYGYRVPVTVTNGTDTETTNIYLDEQLTKSGDNADYIDYNAQKRYNVDGTFADVTVPALLTLSGTNTLSVGTEVQPSKVYIKDAFDYKKVFIGMRKIENKTPANYKNIEDNNGTLKNYRIYGNTVDGESVGDLISDGEHTGEYKVAVTVEGKNLCNNIWEQKMISADTGVANSNASTVCCDFIPVKPNVTYSCSRTIRNNYINLRCYGANKDYLGTGADLANKSNPLKQWESFGTFMITDARVSYIRFNDNSNSLDTKYMLVEGAYTAETMPLYEPYQAPVTVPIYLPEPIKMVGDEAEYVDFEEQKQHFADGTSVDVMLPALPTIVNTNILSIDTQVPPSQVMVKGKIKAHPTGGENNG